LEVTASSAADQFTVYVSVVVLPPYVPLPRYVTVTRCLPRGSVDVLSDATPLPFEVVSATTVDDTPSMVNRTLPVGALLNRGGETVTLNVVCVPKVPVDGEALNAVVVVFTDPLEVLTTWTSVAEKLGGIVALPR
jgi:hypothetical protein